MLQHLQDGFEMERTLGALSGRKSTTYSLDFFVLSSIINMISYSIPFNLFN